MINTICMTTQQIELVWSPADEALDLLGTSSIGVATGYSISPVFTLTNVPMLHTQATRPYMGIHPQS